MRGLILVKVAALVLSIKISSQRLLYLFMIEVYVVFLVLVVRHY